ncbi:MAG TPA: hypothetical protein IAC12_08120 [Candidatus Aphodovivens avistercoris]|nr:hypothetical protein [Candidatus Aphodovivens avistercoris]
MGIFSEIRSRLGNDASPFKFKQQPKPEVQKPANDDFINPSDGTKSKITVHNECSDSVTTRERCALDVKAACGFDFSNVLLQENMDVDVDTGEILTHRSFVELENENLQKVLADIRKIAALSRDIKESVASWPEVEFLRLVDLLNLASAGKANPSRAVITSAALIVNELTPTGKLKKYPITASICFDEYDEIDYSNPPERLSKADTSKTLTIVIKYLASEEVGRAELGITAHYLSHKALFERSKSDGLKVKKVESMRLYWDENGYLLSSGWDRLL